MVQLRLQFENLCERPSWPVDFLAFILNNLSVMICSLLLQCCMGWSLKSSSVRCKTDSCVLGLAKKSLSTAFGFDVCCLLS